MVLYDCLAVFWVLEVGIWLLAVIGQRKWKNLLFSLCRWHLGCTFLSCLFLLILSLKSCLRLLFLLLFLRLLFGSFPFSSHPFWTRSQAIFQWSCNSFLSVTNERNTRSFFFYSLSHMVLLVLSLSDSSNAHPHSLFSELLLFLSCDFSLLQSLCAILVCNPCEPSVQSVSRYVFGVRVSGEVLFSSCWSLLHSWCTDFWRLVFAHQSFSQTSLHRHHGKGRRGGGG